MIIKKFGHKLLVYFEKGVNMFPKETAYIIANFGGPRNLTEIRPFLETLLTDPDVIRTKWPKFMQEWLFKKIAKRRAKKIQKDYKKIGGKSPIFQDTENLAYALSEKLDKKVLTFHRYLPTTHQNFIDEVNQLKVDEIKIFPMFPQFSYATTGSIARFFSKHFEEQTLRKMRWIKSYPGSSHFINSYQKKIEGLFLEKDLKQDETMLLFSAHGVPEEFITSGDIYESECQISFQRIMQKFPYVLGKLSFQSKFGKGEWIKPYTEKVCHSIDDLSQGRKNIIIVPLSFTSDHIETLYEIEYEYVPILRNKGYQVYRCPALNLDPNWISSIYELLKSDDLLTNPMLIRKPLKEKN